MLTIVALLVFVPMATSISCYYCNGCASNAALSSDGITSYTVCGTYYSPYTSLWYRGGSSFYSSCTVALAAYQAAGYTNTKCCTTDLCNGSQMTAVSFILAIGAVLFSLVRVF